MVSTVSVMAVDYSNITGHYERYIDNKIDTNAAYIDVANHEHDNFQLSGSALWLEMQKMETLILEILKAYSRFTTIQFVTVVTIASL